MEKRKKQKKIILALLMGVCIGLMALGCWMLKYANEPIGAVLIGIAVITSLSIVEVALDESLWSRGK